MKTFGNEIQRDEQRDQERRLLKSTLAITWPTLLSRILGYIRDMLQAFYLGTGRAADAFTIAYIIPNLMRRQTGEGGMASSFIPVFTQLKSEKGQEEAWKFANFFFFDLCLVVLSLAVLGIVFAPLFVRAIAPGFGEIPGKWELTTLLTRVMFPYIFFISLAALAMAVLNSFHNFFVPAFTPVFFNIAVIGAAVFFARGAGEPAFVFASGVVLGGLLQLAFQLPFLWKKGMRFRPMPSFSHPAVRQVARLAVPSILGAGVYQVNFALSRVLASSLEEESVSSLYYASRVEELTLGLFSIAFSVALLPSLSELAVRSEISGIKKTLVFSFKAVSLVTFPAMAGLLVLNRPIIQVLFERGLFDPQSTSLSASCLFFFSLGLPFISGAKILAPAFYSLKDTKTPAVVAVLVMISYILLSLVLMKPLHVGGLALALSLSSFFNFAALFFLLEKKIGRIEKRSLFQSVLKFAFFSAAMGGVVWLYSGRFDFVRLAFVEKLGVLLSAIAIGIVAYLILNLLFNRKDLRRLTDIFSRRRILKD